MSSRAAYDHAKYILRKAMPGYKEQRAAAFARWAAKGGRAQIKIEVLSHYGPDGKLQCCWPGCEVADIDMLSLDHVRNDGAKDRNTHRGAGGVVLYQRLLRAGFPDGFQTLCHNHQWKKELMRRRGE
jgi:hypothetical protein